MFVAKGYRLIALAKPPSKGAHIVVIQRPRRGPATEKTTSGYLPSGEGAFVWVDSGGDPVLLPGCPHSSFENQYVLSGDVYVESRQPDHGVVESDASTRRGSSVRRSDGAAQQGDEADEAR
jgi:hypothetical protein